MNEYIRMAETARAMIVNIFSILGYRPNPIPKGIGLRSVAISVGDPAVELRNIVSIPAEKAITGWMCGSNGGGLPMYPGEVEKLILY